MPAPLPDWPPKDWRAFAALVFSVLGAVALTLLLYLLAAMLLPERGWHVATEAARAATIRWIAWIGVAGVVLVLTGLGFAINRRALRGRWGDKSIDWEGGEDPDEEPGEHAGTEP